MICLWSSPPEFNCYWGSTVGLLLLQRFRVGLLFRTCLVSSQWWIFIYMFAVLIHWLVEVLHAGRTTSTCIWTTAEHRARLLQHTTGLSSPVTQLFITGRSKAMLLLWFILIVNVRPLSGCLWLTVQFIYDSLVAICWERAVPLAFHLCCFYFSVVLIVGVPFLFGSIEAVPDRCLFIYFSTEPPFILWI